MCGRNYYEYDIINEDLVLIYNLFSLIEKRESFKE